MRRLPAPILPVVLVFASLLLLLLLESPLASASSRPRRATRASRPLFLGASSYRHHRRLTAFTGASASSSSPRHMARSPTALGAAAADTEDDPWVFDVLFTVR